MTDFTPQRQPMICGSAVAEQNVYWLHVGKNGHRWLVADRPDCGSYVYVEGGPDSDGFGGRTLRFELVTGEVLELKGPWHSNSEALFAATGVDVRDKHLTFGVVLTGIPDNNPILRIRAHELSALFHGRAEGTTMCNDGLQAWIEDIENQKSIVRQMLMNATQCLSLVCRCQQVKKGAKRNHNKIEALVQREITHIALY